MTSGDLLADAIAELYSADPDEFVQRRTALVSGAREAGQAAAARRIAGLRKPTRSAWVVNQLIRSSPDVVTDLADLGEELRAAQRSLDGEAVRQLSQRRRRLVADLVRQALEVSGQNAPSAVLRDEVSATFGAAVMDPEVAGQLAAGTLERAVHREGFGAAGPPVLTLVPPPEDGSQVRRAAPRPAGAAAPRGTTTRGATRGAARGATARRRQTVPKAPAEADAEAARAEQERRRQDALADAERDAAQAAQAAAAATTAEHQQEEAVRQLEEQLAQARVRLSSVRQEARRARARERSAQQALDRRRAHS